MREKRFGVAALAVTALVTLTATLAVLALLLRLLLGPEGFAVLEGVALVNTRFVEQADRQGASDAALAGLVDSLGDRWSVYLDPQDYQDMLQRRENAYEGVGLTYQKREEPPAMEIVGLVEGGPAQREGLQVGDRILGVDGQLFTQENFEELTASIAGQEGQAVTLTVEDAQGARREVTMVRERVETSPVEYEMLEGGVGYVRLNNFYDNSAQRAQEAVDDLVGQGARCLLFDVRSNPGGYVRQLTQLLDYLLPQGPIFTERTRRGPVRVTESDEQCVDLPMAVLINGDSYSAAELFAAQLRESVGAPLIGEQTCGKGYYQQAFSLANGGALNLSTGAYTTGGGLSLIGVGLTPDVEEEDWSAQLERGVETLREKTG